MLIVADWGGISLIIDLGFFSLLVVTVMWVVVVTVMWMVVFQRWILVAATVMAFSIFFYFFFLLPNLDLVYLVVVCACICGGW